MNQISRNAARLLALIACMAGCSAVHASTQTRTSSFTYDDVTGLLMAETVEPDDGRYCVVTTYGYDAYGNKTSSSTANCGANVPARAVFTSRSTTSAFVAQAVTAGGVAVNVPAGTFATSVTNALNQTETRITDPRFGDVMSITGPNGLTSTIQYDEFGRKELEIAPDGNRVRTSYCLLGAAISDTSSNSASCSGLSTTAAPGGAVSFVHTVPLNASSSVIGPYAQVYLDRLGRTIRTVTQGFDGGGQSARLIVKDTTYNINGAAEFTSQPYFLDSNASVGTGASSHGGSLVVYDVLGRSVANYTTDDDGSQTAVVFPGGLGTRRAAVATQTYQGLRTTETNDKSQSRITTKDPLGRRLLVQDTTGAQIAYLHDPFDNLIRVRDALGNITQASFDIRGRRLSITDPDSGLTQHDYDALGQLVWQQNATQRAASTATTFRYDVLGRQTERALPEFTTTWTYDRYANNSACSRGIGKLCEVVTTHGVTRRMVYDSLGRPSSSTQSVSAGPSYTTSVSYDALGRVDRRTWPTGLQVTHSYTSLGYLERLNHSATNALIWQAQRLNAWGQLELQAAGNGVQTTRTSSATDGLIQSIRAGTGNAVLNLNYAWDSLDNLKNRNDGNGAGTGVGVFEVFDHDALNRLKSYQVQSPSITGLARTVTLQYNALGSLLYKSDVGPYSYPAAGAPRPHAVSQVSGANYNYDANGNLLTTTAGVYRDIRYTSFNLPNEDITSGGVRGTNGTRYAWKYGPDLERLQETRISGGITRTTWNLHPDKQGGLGFEQEVQGGTTRNRHYVSAGGAVVAMLTTDGSHTVAQAQTITRTDYWHEDHLGSLAAITNAQGTATSRYAYDPFGKRRYVNGNADPNGSLAADYPNGADRGFTGHEHLDDVGIIHMNGRLYDPRIARFMQADPIVGSVDDLQSFNLYSYVGNNPLNATDPSGYFSLRSLIRSVARLPLIGLGGPKRDIKIAFEFIRNQPGQEYIDRFTTSSPTIYAIGQIVATAASFYCYGCAGYAYTAYYTYLQTGSANAVTRAVAIQAATAAAFYGAGTFAQSVGNSSGATAGAFARVAGHAVAGCATAEMQGGNCGTGAVSSVASLVGGGLASTDNPAVNVAIHAAIGGTVSVMGGGEFANGAVTGAFGYLFNHLLHKESVRALFGSAKGHHPFAKQWANEYRELISEDALGVLATNTIGHDVIWEGGHPNKWGPEHKEYNDVGGRRIVDNFFAEKGITPTNQLGTKQSYELLERLNRHDFNVKMQDYVDVQRSNGRFNANRVFRSRGSTSQPGD